jgi:hypothetical protein
MGRTFRQAREHDDDSSKGKKTSKHSRNIPGKGMRILNEPEDLYDDLDDDLEYEYNDDTTQYYANRRK